MAEALEKIELDDITFDDMLGDGVGPDPGEDNDPPKPDEEDTPPTPPADDPLEDEEDDDNPPTPPADDQDDDEEEDDDNDDDSVVSQISKQLGYELEEEFEDTPEGLAKLTKTLGAKMAEDQLGQLFESFPLVRNHLEYVLNGGDSQEFMQAYDPRLDYDKVEVKENDVNTQKTILANYFTAKGHDQEFINELLEDYEDTGKLFDKSVQAKTALAKAQNQERQQMIQKRQQMQQEEARAQAEFWEGVSNTLKESNELAGVTVVEKDKSKFFDYISKPIDNTGRTQRDLDYEKADIKAKMAMDYLMFKGFDLETLVDKRAKSKNAATLKDRLSRNQQAAKNYRKKGTRKPSSTDLDDIVSIF